MALCIAGGWLLMQAAWCNYMDDTEKYYPTDSRILPSFGRNYSGMEPEDIGFDIKRLICPVGGGFLILCAVILLV